MAENVLPSPSAPSYDDALLQAARQRAALRNAERSGAANPRDAAAAILGGEDPVQLARMREVFRSLPTDLPLASEDGCIECYRHNIRIRAAVVAGWQAMTPSERSALASRVAEASHNFDRTETMIDAHAMPWVWGYAKDRRSRLFAVGPMVASDLGGGVLQTAPDARTLNLADPTGKPSGDAPSLKEMQSFYDARVFNTSNAAADRYNAMWGQLAGTLESEAPPAVPVGAPSDASASEPVTPLPEP